MIEIKITDPHFLPHVGCDLSLSFDKQLIIIGENGIGKTTLLKRVQTAYPQSVLIEQRGLDVFYDRRLKDFKKHFQSSCGSLIEHELFLKLWNDFLLSEKDERQLSTLSGGEMQSLKLVCGLAKKADLFILDEPSQYLDQNKCRVLANALENTVARQRHLLIVEHDLTWPGQGWPVQKLILSQHTLVKGDAWTI